MVYCQICGVQNQDNDRFCRNCGNKLNEVRREQERPLCKKCGQAYAEHDDGLCRVCHIKKFCI